MKIFRWPPGSARLGCAHRLPRFITLPALPTTSPTRAMTTRQSGCKRCATTGKSYLAPAPMGHCPKTAAGAGCFTHFSRPYGRTGYLCSCCTTCLTPLFKISRKPAMVPITPIRTNCCRTAPGLPTRSGACYFTSTA